MSPRKFHFREPALSKAVWKKTSVLVRDISGRADARRGWARERRGNRADAYCHNISKFQFHEEMAFVDETRIDLRSSQNLNRPFAASRRVKKTKKTAQTEEAK